MKNPTDPVGNRTCNLPDCSTVPQPSAPPCTRRREVGDAIYIICSAIKTKLSCMLKHHTSKGQRQSSIYTRSGEWPCCSCFK